MRRALVAAVVALALLAVLPAAAAAHPLGNFSVNHLAEVSISADAVEVRYLLDEAEIPTFQQRDVAAAELLRRKRAEAERRLVLTVDGRRVPLRLAGRPLLTHPPGSGGLRTTRVELPLAAKVRDPRRVGLRDGTFPGRVGWRAIVARPGRGTAVRSSAPSGDPTDGLRRYPEDLLESPADVRAATFTVAPGAGTLDAPDAREGGAADGRGPVDRGVHGRRGRRVDARAAAARGVRLGRAARALAGPRQGDGGRLPRRRPRNRAPRRGARGDRDDRPHGGRVRARRRGRRAVGVRAARGPVSVAEPRVRAARARRRRRGAARPPAAPPSPSPRPPPSPPPRSPGAALVAQPDRAGRVGRPDPLPVRARRAARRAHAGPGGARACC